MLMKLKKFYLIAALMAAPAASFATDYYVNPTGGGKNDGSSWENAMSFEAFCEKVTAGDTESNVYYFAGGKYVFTEPLEILKKGCTLIGGFATNLTGTSHETPTYPSATPTVFTGDVNGDGVASKGDAECLLSFQTVTKNGDESKKVVLKGIELTCAYSQSSPGNNADARGALHLENSGYVEVDNCRFYGNVAEEKTEGGDAKQVGGMAFTGHRSLAVFNDCEFTGNKAVSRGGAIRLTSGNEKVKDDKGRTVFNRCLIANNTIKNDLGSAICMQHGAYLQIINSTVTGNVAGEGASAVYATGEDNLNSRSVYVVNSTIAGNEGGVQVEVTKGNNGANLYVANSIIVSEEGDAMSIGDVKNFGNGGMNVVGSDAGGVLTWGDTDDAKAENTYAAIFGDNVLGANGVIVPLADKGNYKASALATAVADWGIEADLTEDQTGAKRVDGSTPGAYAKTTTTGIQGVEAVEGAGDDAYYTLQGVKLGARPTATGIYIHNGKKVIIR